MIPKIKFPFIVMAAICLLAGAAFVYHAVRHASFRSWGAAAVCLGGAYYSAKTARLW
jgi:hypothetical protein